eukprot:TRINITY_DN59794_c0_g1_i1.p1 TRINITY_DN59794_c0_g1~~TRINITY_DN59794_c0_g1_i1.p1  ORF type:complete len:199 (-),score=24.14 TRINITY_DN59794_c0_g1_i1:24-590(-)
MAAGETVTVDPFRKFAAGLAFTPDFMDILRDVPGPISQSSIHPAFKTCGLSSVRSTPAGAAMEFLDSAHWAHRDVTGTHRRVPSPLQLLNAIASHGVRLSNLAVSIQVAPYLLTQPPSCGSKTTLYDPTHCLIDEKWAGYFYHANPMPPFNLTVEYRGRPTGPGSFVPPFDIHSVHVPDMCTQWTSLV